MIETIIVVVGSVFIVLWINKSVKSAIELRKSILLMPTKKKTKEWIPVSETKDKPRKFYCKQCGTEITETEYESNEGYCNTCFEEEEFFPVWEV